MWVIAEQENGQLMNVTFELLGAAKELCAKLEEKCGFEKNTVKLIPLIETAMGVENAFQPGGDLIRGMGVRVESLARIKAMSVEGGVEFC